jgi:4-amino-4-deoxy-L-arabinose transferase-like glycosyltransferase
MAALDTSADAALIGTSLACGLLTVLLVLTAGRLWYGAAAGAAAGALVALSDFHVLYSRMGLTDVAFALLFLAAVLLYERADRHESLKWALAAGLVVGLAWNTKYHGWLAAPVAGLALLPGWLSGPLPARRRSLLRWLASLPLAVLLYLPWFVLVSREPGGYGQLTADHASFLSDARNAFSHARIHLQYQLFHDGPLARVAPGLGLLLAGLWGGRHPDGAGRGALALLPWALALTAAAWAFSGFAVTTMLALAGLALALREPSRCNRFHLALFATFLVLTPLYRPFPRLLLPWLLASWIYAGAALATLARSLQIAPAERQRVARGAALALTVVAALSLTLRGSPPVGDAWRPSDGFERASVELARLLPAGAAVSVLGEPQLALYLNEEGLRASMAQVADVLERVEAGGEEIVIAGLYARRRGELEAWLSEHPGSGRELGRVAADVNDARLLDDFRSWRAQRYRREPQGEYDLEVFALGPATR